MNAPNKKRNWLGLIIIGASIVVCGRLVWLHTNGYLNFQADLQALLPQVATPDSGVYERIVTANFGKVVIKISAADADNADLATDYLVARLHQNAAVAGVRDGPDTESLTARVRALLPFRDRLLADRTLEVLEVDAVAQIRRRAERVTGFPPTNWTPLAEDPVGLLEDFLEERLPAASGKIVSDGLYLRQAGPMAVNFIFIRLTDDALVGDALVQAVADINTLFTETMTQFESTVMMTGIPLYVAHIRTAAIAELGWMGVLSSVLVILILSWVLRSWIAVSSTLAMLLAAIVFGLVVAQWAVGLPHIIGLVIALSVVGVCIDFALHFWMHRATKTGVETITTIAPGIGMTMATTVVGYAVVSLTTIPVLRQSAILLCSAVIISWAIVMWVFPCTYHPEQPRQPNHNQQRRPAPLKTLLGSMQVALPFAIIALSGVSLFTMASFDDRPIRLKMATPDLDRDNLEMEAALGLSFGDPVAIMRGEGMQDLLEAEESMLATLDNTQRDGIRAMSRLVPSIQTQRGNRARIASLTQASAPFSRANLREELGYAVAAATSSAPAWHTPMQALTANWGDAERELWLSCTDGICRSLLRADSTTQDALQQVCTTHANCQLFSASRDQELLLADLRSDLMNMVLVVLGVIAIVLFARYGLSMWRLLLAPIAALGSGLACVVWMGYPVNVFTVAAAFPLIGLAADYAIFTAERRIDFYITQRAVFVSALTTMLAFSILSFSIVPAVRFFALPIAVGIPVAWLVVACIQPKIE